MTCQNNAFSIIYDNIFIHFFDLICADC